MLLEFNPATSFFGYAWNYMYLPTDLRQPDLSHSRFKQSLKTFLFGLRDQRAVWISL